jgi:Ca-activated chloride channel homolog
MTKFRAVGIPLAVCWLLSAVPSANGQIQSGPLKPPQQSTPKPDQSKSQIRVEVDLVQVPVTVNDPYGRIVTGLEKKDFHVFEDGVEQEILNFSEDDVPVSIALVLDVSGSMADKMPIVRTGAVEFLRNGNPQDEFMVVDFRSRPHLLSPFTSDPETLQSNMLYLTSYGSTALLDGVRLALINIHTAHNPRRAIVLISDGGDNFSLHSEIGVERMFTEADTQFYAVLVFGAPKAPEEVGGPAFMQDLAKHSGGRFLRTTAGSIPDTVQKIGDELRSEYVLAFRPANHGHDGKYHKLHVQVDPPRGVPPLTLYSRTGYTSPKK